MNLVTLELNGETTLLLINNAKVASNRECTVDSVFGNLVDKAKKKLQFSLKYSSLGNHQRNAFVRNKTPHKLVPE